MTKNIIILVLILPLLSFSQNFFTNYQSLQTNGANDFKSFVINDTTYLVLANYRKNATVETSSYLYRWDNSEFIEEQEFETMGASDWEFFTINDNNYLVVANYKSETDYTVNSIIYKRINGRFEEFQLIETTGAYDWEAFKIDTMYFLAVANQTNDGNNEINSVIYKWNGEEFVNFQNILTNGISDWEFFNFQNSYYLAAANTFEISLPLYKWNGSSFELFSTINSMANTGAESFIIENELYIVTASGMGFNQSYSTFSKIFKWNGADFTQIQTIATVGAFDWEYFQVEDKQFLAVANYKGDGEIFEQTSKIFFWNNERFELFQNIETNGATDFEYMNIDNENYLAIAEYKTSTHNHEIESKIMKMDSLVLHSKTLHSKNTNIIVTYNRAEVVIKELEPSIKKSIRLVDYLGREIYKGITENNYYSMPISTIIKGTYILSITTKESIYTEKLFLY